MAWRKKLLLVDRFLLEPFSERHQRVLTEKFPGLDVVDCTVSREKVKEAICDAHIVFGSITRDEFLCGHCLEFIQVLSQGVERMQFPELTDSPALLANARGVWSPAIAEHILALILAYYRNLPELFRRQQSGEWLPKTAGFSMLHGRTVAFLGTGDIAEHAARLLVPFDCPILGFNLRGDCPGFCKKTVTADGLAGILSAADVVINTLPLTPQTTRLVGRDAFQAMKKTALFINVGRGKTVDEQALIEALETGVIAAAAPDVFEAEPLPPDSPLWHMPNVIISPHKAGLGRSDAPEALFQLLLDNLQRFRDGVPLCNLVSKSLRY